MSEEDKRTNTEMLAVQIGRSEEIMHFYCGQTTKVHYLKQMIFDHKFYCIRSQALVYEGRIMKDEFELREYRIQENHAINLVIKKSETIDLNIKTPDNQILKITADSLKSILELKIKIKEILTHHNNSFKLFYRETELLYDLTLDDYEIKTGYTLDIIFSAEKFFDVRGQTDDK